ncbi:hypothetical protein [Paludisphaera rhizosphaerae]|uniref:hypothetical protein n=1 Tax=Paludisphaera rhizosphaerae TaxID=2711216 RepID=UPI0013ECE06B|nr:hypothetical protein [Paludisphaera rhizosphaerae]
MHPLHNRPADPAVHEASIRMARRCRRVVQACLREEEWGDADREFYSIIREGLEALASRKKEDRTC